MHGNLPKNGEMWENFMHYTYLKDHKKVLEGGTWLASNPRRLLKD
jgi:hypothetical protein